MPLKRPCPCPCPHQHLCPLTCPCPCLQPRPCSQPNSRPDRKSNKRERTDCPKPCTKWIALSLAKKHTSCKGPAVRKARTSSLPDCKKPLCQRQQEWRGVVQTGRVGLAQQWDGLTRPGSWFRRAGQADHVGSKVGWVVKKTLAPNAGAVRHTRS